MLNMAQEGDFPALSSQKYQLFEKAIGESLKNVDIPQGACSPLPNAWIQMDTPKGATLYHHQYPTHHNCNA